jgi:hypothetical protein
MGYMDSSSLSEMCKKQKFYRPKKIETASKRRQTHSTRIMASSQNFIGKENINSNILSFQALRIEFFIRFLSLRSVLHDSSTNSN